MKCIEEARRLRHRGMKNAPRPKARGCITHGYG